MTDSRDQGRTMEVTRLLNAPRERVFEAFGSAEQIDQWWGPNGFRNETHEMTFKTGGLWRYTMHGPDGKPWPNWIRYTLIEPPARLVYEHGGEIGEPAHFHGEITLEDLGAQTRIVLRLLFPTVEAMEAARKFGAVEGGNQTLARLDAFVSEQAS